ncbi:MAG: TIGR04076 family protein [Candidatus Bipolaricaulia bacterium]
MPSVRITVLKRTFQDDILEQEIRDEKFKRQFGPCSIFEDGQAFVSEDWPTMPSGFCERAWPDIRHEVAMVMYKATAPWITPAGFTITCCNDGVRPVIFRIERLEH